MPDIQILVIEDDADLRHDLCDLLCNQPCPVIDVPDAASALEAMRDGAETIVVLDPFAIRCASSHVDEVMRNAAAVLTIPVLGRGFDAERCAPLHRSAVHYGVLLEAVRDELRRLVVGRQGPLVAPSWSASASPAPSTSNAPAKAWGLAPLLSRWRSERLSTENKEGPSVT